MDAPNLAKQLPVCQNAFAIDTLQPDITAAHRDAQHAHWPCVAVLLNKSELHFAVAPKMVTVF